MKRLAQFAVVVLAIVVSHDTPVAAQDSIANDDAKPDTAYLSLVSDFSPDESGAAIVRQGLTRNDLYWLRKTVRGAEKAVAVRCMPATVRYAAMSSDAVIVGCADPFKDLTALKVHRGRFLTTTDVKHSENICVIGRALAERLFAQKDPLGRNVRIDRDYYLVVGVVAAPRISLESLNQAYQDSGVRASRSRPGTPNLEVYIPRTTMKSRMGDVHLLRTGGSFLGRNFQLSEIWIPTNDNTLALQEALDEIRTDDQARVKFNVRKRMAFPLRDAKNKSISR